MTVQHLARGFRRSCSKILKVGLRHIHSELSITRPVKLIPRPPKKAKDYSYIVSSRINKWIVINFILSAICIIVHCAPWIMNKIDNTVPPSFNSNNQTLANNISSKWSYYDWCSSSTGSLNNTSGLVIDDQSVVLLFIIFSLISIIGLLFFFDVLEKVRQLSSDTSNRHFAQGLFSLILLAIFSLGNQSIGSLTCRPKEILNEGRYTSILRVQFIGFVLSLVAAYSLGSLFIPLFDQIKIDSASDHSHITCCRSVKRLTPHRLRS